jgi:hypothetical protein
VIRGVVTLSPRSLALSILAPPRTYLWIHLERKEAIYALAETLPIPADPRGSRFGALEDPIRGLAIRSMTASRDGAFLLTAGAPESEATHSLALHLDGPRANLTLRRLDDGAILWAFHREEAGPPPPGFQAPRALEAVTPEALEELRAAIDRAFRDDFDREAGRELDQAERALRKRLEAQGGDLKRARAQIDARRRGEILLANYAKISRGASRVSLPDTFADSPGAEIEITLDPALSPHENAALLFQRAKKGERGVQLVERRLAETQKSLERLAALRRDIETRPPKESLRLRDEFLKSAGLQSVARGDTRKIRLGRRTAGAPRAGRPGTRPPGARESIRPRTFSTSEGWEVWVGRNNTENDRLTHRLSNPHDFWFHVVGVPGSHVILRRPTRSAIPKRSTLEEAAAIAAYFSKARKLTRVPVIFTERKFVSKPRRGKPGQAICTREKELLVRPGIPKGAPDTNAGDRDEREVSD